jgi:hypothetical protein
MCVRFSYGFRVPFPIFLQLVKFANEWIPQNQPLFGSRVRAHVLVDA